MQTKSLKLRKADKYNSKWTLCVIKHSWKIYNNKKQDLNIKIDNTT